MAIPNLNLFNFQNAGLTPVSFAGSEKGNSRQELGVSGKSAFAPGNVTPHVTSPMQNAGLAERLGNINGELSPVVTGGPFGNNLDIMC